MCCALGGIRDRRLLGRWQVRVWIARIHSTGRCPLPSRSGRSGRVVGVRSYNGQVARADEALPAGSDEGDLAPLENADQVPAGQLQDHGAVLGRQVADAAGQAVHREPEPQRAVAVAAEAAELEAGGPGQVADLRAGQEGVVHVVEHRARPEQTQAVRAAVGQAGDSGGVVAGDVGVRREAALWEKSAQVWGPFLVPC